MTATSTRPRTVTTLPPTEPSAQPHAVARDMVVDLVITDQAQDGNPFDAEYRVTLEGPNGELVTVPGYFAPTIGCVARASFPSPGQWSARVTASPDDSVQAVWQFQVGDPVNASQHGALMVDPQHPRHFMFADGTRYFLRGYEVDWLAMIDQHDENLTRVRQFLDSIQSAGFTFVTMNAYAHSFRQYVPEDLEADPRWIVPRIAPWVGGNSQPDYSTLDEAFFEHFDRVIAEMQHRGLIAHIMIHVYNKDVNWPEPASADDDRYWRHMVARYQAFPNVVWDTAKESYHRPPSYIWTRVALIRQLDGYRRLLTVHDANPPHDVDWGRQYVHPDNELIDALTDFTADQILHDIHADAERHTVRYTKPYVNIEFGYESGVDDLPSDHPDHDQHWHEVTRRMWQVVMGGGYPNYYYRNTAWSLFIPFPEPPGYGAVRVLADFWDAVEYWRLRPARHLLVGAARDVALLARPGAEFVAYSEKGESFAIDLGDGVYSVVWLDPYTGHRTPGDDVTGSAALTPPLRGSASVLHLTRIS